MRLSRWSSQITGQLTIAAMSPLQASQGALFLLRGLGRFISEQGCFKIPVKMLHET